MKHGPEIRSPGGNRDGGWSFCRIASHARGSRGSQRAVAERGWGYRPERLNESGAMSTTKSSVVYTYMLGGMRFASIGESTVYRYQDMDFVLTWTRRTPLTKPRMEIYSFASILLKNLDFSLSSIRMVSDSQNVLKNRLGGAKCAKIRSGS